MRSPKLATPSAPTSLLLIHFIIPKFINDLRKN
jgi:hypothetical protein